MTKKTMMFTTGMYILCALVWTLNFFINWHQDGMIEVSTGLFGVSAVCFAIAAVLNVIRLMRLRKTDESKEDK